ncbi:MAG TPA: branched-chain amino acid ABC transporter permease [Syntrophales bacterium]|jgi:branched-chain amino acid transport system permease protein|nr:branched-chain amino acid ABC transporter permease [Syntrophales bacterium]HOU76665.1 branched-chain amino acid ABC transporter permease [Syntrophales bacterium]HQG33328.1 branched-chain amino acid ABC transporter permease [Syntrophales bacterium]HQI35478.1 branched-chain amino acid ABC transporter permease [Syntrophales bacterium]HQJ29591.1 branched-chain amino acid ABC transporter permease [Syntrophales bacterium]
MEFFVQLMVNGLSVGFLYGISAMGFVMIFKSSSVLNFAHGELLAIGAYIFLVLATGAQLPVYAAFIITMIACFSLGFVVERLFLRPLIGEPLIFVIMLTVGLAAMFKGLILLIWGGNLYTFPDFLPPWLTLTWGSVTVQPVYTLALVVGIVFLALFGLFFKFSSQGIYMRSVADNQRAALSLGVNVRNVFALSWAIAALVAGLSGIILGIINGVNVHDLSALGLKVFPVVILGGLDSIGGAIIGGLIIGILETLTGGYISPSLRDVVPYIVLVVILMLKPYGLFGQVEIERV